MSSWTEWQLGYPELSFQLSCGWQLARWRQRYSCLATAIVDKYGLTSYHDHQAIQSILCCTSTITTYYLVIPTINAIGQMK